MSLGTGLSVFHPGLPAPRTLGLPLPYETSHGATPSTCSERGSWEPKRLD